MKKRTLLILAAVLVVLSGLTGLILYLGGRQADEVPMGRLLFEKLNVNSAAEISIQSADGAFSVAKKGAIWQVNKGFDYPADFDKVARFLRGLTELKVGRAFSATSERLARLTLESPASASAKKEEKGALFVVKDSAGKEIVRLIAGKERPGTDQFKGMPQGQFLLPGEGKTIYLVDRFFEMEEQKPADWMDKSLVSVEAADIKSITCLAAGGGASPTVLYALARAEKGKDMTAVTFPTGKKASRPDIDRMTQFLSTLSCDDVEKPGAGLAPADRLFDFTTFAGATYRVSVFGPVGPDGCKVRIEVLYSGSDKKTAEETQKINARLSPWIFRVGKWRSDYLARDPEALVEKPQAQQAGPGDGVGMPPGMPPGGMDPSMFGAP